MRRARWLSSNQTGASPKHHDEINCISYAHPGGVVEAATGRRPGF
jgi:hypothetical protein